MNERYARQIQVDEIGTEGQLCLAQACVLIVGVGGLGCTIATQLAGAGVGKIVLLDHDVVNLSNLHRQTLYREADIDRPKATVAAERLRQLNSTIAVEAFTERLSPENASQLCGKASLVIDAADNFAVSYLLSDTCTDLNLPLLSASVNRTFGYLGLFCDGAPSLKAVFPKLPKEQTSCDTVGVTGPSVGIIASIQAQEAIKVLIGKPGLKGKLLYLDLWNFTQHQIDVSQVKESEKDGMALISAKDINPADFVIDVRTSDEVTASPQAFKVNLHKALDEILLQNIELPKARLVIACQSGQRAMLAAQTLLANGHNRVAVVLPRV